MSTMIDMSGLKSWSPFEGASDLLRQDGFYVLATESVRVGTSKAEPGKTGNTKLVLTHVIQDEDEKGKKAIKHIAISGADKDGKPNIKQLGNVYAAIGFSPEQIQVQLAGRGQISAEDLAKELEGMLKDRPVVGEIIAETDREGRTNSSLAFYSTPEKYKQAKDVGAHRRAHKAVPQGFAGGIGGQPANVAAMVPTAGGASSLAPVSAAPTLPTIPSVPAVAVNLPIQPNGAAKDPLLAMLQPRA